ncbi:hypothetical protein ZWY2020_047615 [Hordeum vulgare]|nr:hypothetical protein ZWY2020_047615 [Hordeum vulgare]
MLLVSTAPRLRRMVMTGVLAGVGGRGQPLDFRSFRKAGTNEGHVLHWRHERVGARMRPLHLARCSTDGPTVDYEKRIALGDLVHCDSFKDCDLDFAIDIVGSDRVREVDGLAMSSQNVCIAPEERNKI